MLSTRRSPRQRAVARRKAAVRTSGASRPTRKAADSSSTLQSSSGPICVSTRGVVDQGGLAEECAVAGGEPALQAGGDGGRLRPGRPAIAPESRRCGRRGAERVVAAPGDAEHRVPGVGEQLLGQRRAHAARRAGDDEKLQAVGGLRLLDAGDRPLAAAVGRLDQVPDLVEGLGDAVDLLADQAVEADADDSADRLRWRRRALRRRRGRRRCAAPSRPRSCRSSLTAANISGVVKARRSLRSPASLAACRRMKIILAMRSKPSASKPAGRLRAASGAAAEPARAVPPLPAKAWGSKRAGCIGAPAPANCRLPAPPLRRLRAEAAQQEADREEGDARPAGSA